MEWKEEYVSAQTTGNEWGEISSELGWRHVAGG